MRWTLYRMWLRTEECPFCPFLLYLSMMKWLDVGCVVLKARQDVRDMDGVWMKFVSSGFRISQRRRDPFPLFLPF
jgi:hypothetical protein